MSDPEIREITITLPIIVGELSPGHRVPAIQTRLPSVNQQIAFGRVWLGMRETHEREPGGQYVDLVPAVIRQIGQRIHEAINQ